ncbi:MAG: NAD(P)-dependent oxidoreductase [Chthoniobacterales bacterium]|nr:NAD(P)-dependent oxidoreductase [Chthoniobacterales bacterium]
MNSPLPCEASRIDEFLSEPSASAIRAAASLEGPVGVLGAGGKMGLHMAAMLRRALDGAGRREVPVVAVSRFGSPEARDAFTRFGVETVSADLLDDAALSTLPDFRAVYFMAGIKFGTSEQPGALRRFNEEMPAKVAARFPASRIVAFSSGCVYPFVAIESGGSREEDPVSPQGDYAVSCAGRENAFVEASACRGTPVVLIRLNYAVEFRYGVLVDIAQRVMAGEPLDVTMGHVNVIWQRDAVDHILRSIVLTASPAAVLNVTGLPIVRVRDLAARFGKIFGREPLLTGAEESTAWLNNPGKAFSLFGEPQVGIDQAVEWTAAWLKSGGETIGKPTKFERRDGKY